MMVARRALALCALVGCDEVFDIVEVPSAADAANGPDADGAPPDPALVVHYSLDQLDSFGVTLDVVRSLQAVCVTDGCPSLVQGRRGLAADFDGVDDQLHISRIAELETSSALTVTAWVMQEQALFTDDHGCIISKRFGTGFSNSWQLCTHDPMGVGFISHDGASSDFLYSAAGWTIGEWHHLAATWDSTTKRLYVDGILRQQRGAMIGFDGGEVNAGADIDNNALDAPFPGLLDEIRIYNRALDASEILALASQGL